MLVLPELEDFTANFFERTNVSRIDVGHMNDVIAELGFDRSDDFVFLSSENGFVEFRNHLTLSEEVKIAAAFSCSGVGRIFFS